MTALGFDQVLEGVQDLLFVVAFARLKDIKLLQTQVTLLQAQEDFELKIAIELYSLQIEEEAKKFDQLLRLTSILDEQDEEQKYEQSRLEKQAKKERGELLQLDEGRQKLVDQHLQRMHGLVEKVAIIQRKTPPEMGFVGLIPSKTPTGFSGHVCQVLAPRDQSI
jgi:hypothetical protein